jgi:uncharacterized protein (DUF58 family)
MTLTYRAWAVLSAGGLVALLGAARPDLLGLTLLIDLLAVVIIAVDALSLPRATAFRIQRRHERVLSLGAENRIELTLIHDLTAPRTPACATSRPPTATTTAASSPCC